MSAPFEEWSRFLIPSGYRPVLEATVRDWKAKQLVATLDVVSASLSEDVTWKPRVKFEATIARSPALEALPLIDGLYVDLRTGYAWLDEKLSDVQPTHAWLFVRELVPIIGTGTSRLLATSAESLLIDAADDEQVYGAATFTQFLSALRAPVDPANTVLGGDAFRSWWSIAGGGMVLGSIGARAIGVHKRESDLSSWADALQAACEANALEWHVDRRGVLRIEEANRAATSRPLTFDFTDGTTGTVIDFRPTRSLEPFANDVWVLYAGGITGRAANLDLGHRRKTHVVDRSSIGGTESLAAGAASSIYTRLIRSYGQTFELDAAAVYWLEAGHRVTVALAEWPRATYIVEAVNFRFPKGDMTVTLRPI